MSGLETIKIIVDAEKEAENLLSETQAKALEIRKQLDSLILKEREEKLSDANKEATSILQVAKSESEKEAIQYEKESEGRIKELVERASAKKSSAVKILCDVLLR